MNLQDLATSAALEKEGVWLSFMGAEFLVAQHGNDKYNRFVRRRTQGIPQGKLKDPKVIDPILIEAMAETILLSFRAKEEKVMNGDVELEPTPENRLLLCQNKVFREWLATASTDFTNYQEVQKDAEISDLKSRPVVEP